MSSMSLNIVAENLFQAVMNYYESGEYVKPFRSKDLADCVVKHAAAGGVSAMGVAVLPGIGGLISGGVAIGAIWTMYIKICNMIGMPFQKNKLKSLASAVLTNVATQLAGVFALSFIPGAGVIAGGIVNFAVTYFAGLTFLMMLTKLFKTERKDFLEYGENEWKDSFKEALKEIDKKAIIKEAKNLFMNMKDDGSLEKLGNDVEFEKDE